MKTWVKLYTKVVNDPELGALSFADRGIWMMLLALAGQLDHRDDADAETGELDTLPRIAWYLRCAVAELEPAIQTFLRLGMVEDREGILYIPKYPKCQATPPSERNETVRQRVRNHRARRQQQPEHVTTLQPASNDAETTLEVEKNREDSETEERQGERARCAGAPPPPPILAFREITNYCPAPGSPSWDEIAALPADSESLKRWRTTVEEWMLRGFKVRNVAGMLDWFDKGIPPRGPVSPRRARAIVRPTDPELQRVTQITEQRWIAEHGD